MVNKDLLREASITGNKLTHLNHTEDLYLFGERAGAFAIKALKDVFSALQGNPSETDITLKVDGAPSVLAASNFNGDAFVATKGFFAKDRKIAFTEEDCKEYYGHAPDLERKMSKLLSYMHAIDIPQGEIWQGDFLFDSESLDKDIIEGEEHLIFHPNTIIYAVPMKDPLAKKISRSDVGVAWHTMYKGPDYDNLKISFGANVDNLGEVPGVFQIDSRIPNLANAMLDREESREIQIMIEDIVDLFNKVSQSGILTQIEEDNALQKYLLTYRNFLIKTKGIEEEETYLDGIIGWLAGTFDKEIAKKKQPSTKEKYEIKKQEEIQKIENAREDLEEVVKLQNMTRRAKQALIDKLNGLGTFRTLVRHIDQGYLPAGEEGYAISDIDGNIQKFVSRLEFSKNNFSQEIVKGWMSDNRMQQSMRRMVINRFREGVDPGSLEKLAAEIIAKLQQVATTMDKEQLVALKNEMLSLMGEEVVIMKHLDRIMSLFSKFKERLIPMFYEAFRSVDDDALKIFMDSAMETPIIEASTISKSKTRISSWAGPLNDRLNSLPLEADDKRAILRAVANTYEVFVGGNSGMGKGEVQYALLCGGSKPMKGDLSVPGFGEIEIKGLTGRMRGVSAPLGSNETPYLMIKKYLASVTDLQDLSKYPAGAFTLKKRANTNIIWDEIKKRKGNEAPEIIENIFILWARGSYGGNFERYRPDNSLIEGAAEAVMQGDWLEAMAYQAALQYSIYKQADGFKGILFVSPTNFFFAEDPLDIVNGVVNKSLVITPASLGDNIGAAAGLNIPQR